MDQGSVNLAPSRVLLFWGYDSRVGLEGFQREDRIVKKSPLLVGPLQNFHKLAQEGYPVAARKTLDLVRVSGFGLLKRLLSTLRVAYWVPCSFNQ